MATDNESMTDTDTNMSKPAEILYRVFSDELRFAKRQQWTITNYTVLLMGAMYAVARLSSPATLGKIVLCALVALILSLGLFVLFDLQGTCTAFGDVRRTWSGPSVMTTEGLLVERKAFAL